MLKILTVASVAALLSTAASAAVLEWESILLPENELHDVTTGDKFPFGIGQGTYNTETRELSWEFGAINGDDGNDNNDLGGIDWEDLTGLATAMHFHNGFDFEAGPVVINIFENSDPVNNNEFTSGGSSFYEGNVFGSAIVPDDDALITKLLNDGFYINIHTEENPAGEIRGQVVFANDMNMAPVPVPAGLPLALTGLAALGFVARRRKA